MLYKAFVFSKINYVHIAVYNLNDEEFIERKIIRQIDKSNNNHIGYFHQNIFRYIQDWEVFEFAGAIKEVQPKVFLGKNVRGLLRHDRRRTIRTTEAVLSEIGYTLMPPQAPNALLYRVPQKQQRLFWVGIRNDLVPYAQFAWPSPCPQMMTLADALEAGVLYESDVPASVGQRYPEQKAAILQQVPEGGVGAN
ncbi:MAG TPA: Eco47II family restriction endonuclease [Thermosynechococcus sp. M55_K2018_012]|nr:Eco47II family restriction endonuclease [Thermosynechococcus sp. M55_K2018_012]